MVIEGKRKRLEEINAQGKVALIKGGLSFSGHLEGRSKGRVGFK